MVDADGSGAIDYEEFLASFEDSSRQLARVSSSNSASAMPLSCEQERRHGLAHAAVQVHAAHHQMCVRAWGGEGLAVWGGKEDGEIAALHHCAVLLVHAPRGQVLLASC